MIPTPYYYFSYMDTDLDLKNPELQEFFILIGLFLLPYMSGHMYLR